MTVADRTPRHVAPAPRAAATAVPVHDLLAARWSTRAFDPAHELTGPAVQALLEAARWAPSANNTQPWRFAVARRGTPEHAALLAALAPGNQVWAGAASALVVVAALTADPDGAALPWAVYDAGQAAAHLTVQAQHEGLSVHQMGGFDRGRVAALLAGDGADGAPAPLVVLAVGRHDPAVQLPEPFAGRERSPRERRAVADLLLEVRAGA